MNQRTDSVSHFLFWCLGFCPCDISQRKLIEVTAVNSMMPSLLSKAVVATLRRTECPLESDTNKECEDRDSMPTCSGQRAKSRTKTSKVQAKNSSVGDSAPDSHGNEKTIESVGRKGGNEVKPSAETATVDSAQSIDGSDKTIESVVVESRLSKLKSGDAMAESRKGATVASKTESKSPAISGKGSSVKEPEEQVSPSARSSHEKTIKSDGRLSELQSGDSMAVARKGATAASKTDSKSPVAKRKGSSVKEPEEQASPPARSSHEKTIESDGQLSELKSSDAVAVTRKEATAASKRESKSPVAKRKGTAVEEPEEQASPPAGSSHEKTIESDGYLSESKSSDAMAVARKGATAASKRESKSPVVKRKGNSVEEPEEQASPPAVSKKRQARGDTKPSAKDSTASQNDSSAPSQNSAPEKKQKAPPDTPLTSRPPRRQAAAAAMSKLTAPTVPVPEPAAKKRKAVDNAQEPSNKRQKAVPVSFPPSWGDISKIRALKPLVDHVDFDAMGKKVKLEFTDLCRNDELNDPADNSLAAKDNRRFEAGFVDFLAFCKIYGHGIVPKLFPERPSLGRWVQMVRQWKTMNNEDRLTPSRLERLNQAGFVWDAKAHPDYKVIFGTSKQSDDRWEKMFQILLNYKAEKGHCNVPKDSYYEKVTPVRTFYLLPVHLPSPRSHDKQWFDYFGVLGLVEMGLQTAKGVQAEERGQSEPFE
jgi:Helicase associated domain